MRSETVGINRHRSSCGRPAPEKKLVENLSDYFHSSAAFYILGEENKYVTSFMKMQDIDLSK